MPTLTDADHAKIRGILIRARIPHTEFFSCFVTAQDKISTVADAKRAARTARKAVSL